MGFYQLHKTQRIPAGNDEVWYFKEYFVDEQRVGPYAIWHHEHKIESIEGGVLMTGIESYKPPFGFLGSIANSVLIKNQLRKIFDYRNKAIENMFGEMT